MTRPIVRSTNSDGFSGSNGSITAQNTTRPGDLMVVFVMSGSMITSYPQGWTLVGFQSGQEAQGGVLYKTHVEGESLTCGVSFDGGDPWRMSMVVVKGNRGEMGLELMVGQRDGNAGQTKPASSLVESHTNDILDLMLYFVGCRNATDVPTLALDTGTLEQLWTYSAQHTAALWSSTADVLPNQESTIGLPSRSGHYRAEVRVFAVDGNTPDPTEVPGAWVDVPLTDVYIGSGQAAPGRIRGIAGGYIDLIAPFAMDGMKTYDWEVTYSGSGSTETWFFGAVSADADGYNGSNYFELAHIGDGTGLVVTARIGSDYGNYWDSAYSADQLHLFLDTNYGVPDIVGLRYREVEFVELEPGDGGGGGGEGGVVDILAHGTVPTSIYQNYGQLFFNDESGTYELRQNASYSTAGIAYTTALDPTKTYVVKARVGASTGTGYFSLFAATTPDYEGLNGPDSQQIAFRSAATGESVTVFEAKIGPNIGTWNSLPGPIYLVALFSMTPGDPMFINVNSLTIEEYVEEPPPEDPTGGAVPVGTYPSVIAALLPSISWEFDDGSAPTPGQQVPDGTGLGHTGTYVGPDLAFVDSLMADGAGKALKVGAPGVYGSGVLQDDSALNPKSLTIQMTVQMPTSPPYHDVPSDTDVDDAVVLVKFDQVVMQYTKSGGFYAQLGPQNQNLFIVQVGSFSTTYANLVCNILPGETRLLTLVVDDVAHTAALYLDGELVPNYDLGGGLVFPNPAPFTNTSGWFSDSPLTIGNGDPSKVGAYGTGFGSIVDSVHFFDRALTPAQVVGTYTAWSTVTEETDTFGSATSSAVGADLVRNTTALVFAGDAAAGATATAVADFALVKGHYYGGTAAGVASVAVQMPAHRIQQLRTGIQIEARVSGSYVLAPATMTMFILDPVQERTPTALTVVLSGAIPGAMVQFYNGAALLYQVRADASGSLSAVSIPLPPTPAGTYTLRAVCGQREASDPFTISFQPATLKTVSPDADPVEVPGALRADGSRAWVLQDLLPGGLGSYVMPRSPVEGTHSTSEKKLTGRHSTAPDGQHHIWEALSNEYEWTFAGVTFTEDDQEQLYAYGELNRRFYLINDRNEAWVVSFTQVEIVPRLRKLTALAGEELELNDWLADYTVRVVTHDNTWRTPIPLEG